MILTTLIVFSKVKKKTFVDECLSVHAWHVGICGQWKVIFILYMIQVSPNVEHNAFYRANVGYGSWK